MVMPSSAVQPSPGVRPPVLLPGSAWLLSRDDSLHGHELETR
jgi:hypothetical protein